MWDYQQNQLLTIKTTFGVCVSSGVRVDPSHDARVATTSSGQGWDLGVNERVATTKRDNCMKPSHDTLVMKVMASKPKTYSMTAGEGYSRSTKAWLVSSLKRWKFCLTRSRV